MFFSLFFSCKTLDLRDLYKSKKNFINNESENSDKKEN